MIFPKPKLKYTEMAMYIDEKANSDKELSEEELEKMYIYLYHIIRMLAYKEHYFNDTRYYDEFSLMVAADMMNRLIYNPKLNEFDEFGNPKMKRLKSCLNYLKAILYGRKVAFEQQNYSQKLSDPNKLAEINEYSFENQIKQNRQQYIDSNIKLYMGDLGKTVVSYLKSRCIYKDKIIKKNIIISCCLSLLNAVVFSEFIKDDVQLKYITPEAKFNYLCSLYNIDSQDNIVLYHLDESYKNYVSVLLRNVFSLIETDIKDLSVENIQVSDSILASVALSELDGNYIYDD